MAELLDAYARFVLAWIDKPMELFSLLETQSGLNADEALLANLIVFLSFAPITCIAIARVDPKKGVFTKVVAFLSFYIWMNLGMGVECRSSISEGGAGVPDLGHRLLAPLRAYARARPVVMQLACSMNTALVMGTGIYVAVIAFVMGRPQLIITVLPAGSLRMLMGVFTQLPMPPGFVETPGDWPPPSEHCKGFVMNPSGHVVQVTLVCMYLWRCRAFGMCAVYSLMNVVQAVWLVANEGHYTVDVFTGVLVAFLSEQLCWSAKLGHLAPANNKKKRN